MASGNEERGYSEDAEEWRSRESEDEGKGEEHGEEGEYQSIERVLLGVLVMESGDEVFLFCG